jgi:hypothetical protein
MGRLDELDPSLSEACHRARLEVVAGRSSSYDLFALLKASDWAIGGDLQRKSVPTQGDSGRASASTGGTAWNADDRASRDEVALVVEYCRTVHR